MKSSNWIGLGLCLSLIGTVTLFILGKDFPAIHIGSLAIALGALLAPSPGQSQRASDLLQQLIGYIKPEYESVEPEKSTTVEGSVKPIE